jgi:hypothetical protein
MIAVNYPPESLIFFGGMMNLVNFNVIDLTDFYNRILHLDPNSVGNRPLNSQFELMGFCSLYFVQNFGGLLLVALSPFIDNLLWKICKFLSDRKHALCAFLVKRSFQTSWVGFWLSFLNEMFIFLLVCVGINLRNHFEWKEFGDAISSLLSLLIGSALVILPIFVAVFYSQRKILKRIWKSDEEFIQRFGGVIQGLNFRRKGVYALIYPSV